MAWRLWPRRRRASWPVHPRRFPSAQSFITGSGPDATDTAFAVCLDVLLYAQQVEHRDERLDLHVQREGELLNADPSVPRGELGDNAVAECGLVDVSTRRGAGLERARAVSQACPATSRTSMLSMATALGGSYRSAAVRAASSDSNTITALLVPL